MALESVDKLSAANIAMEKAARRAVRKIHIARQALEAVANDPVVNKEGYFNIDTPGFRVNLAEATILIEQAHLLMCDNHAGFNAIVADESNDIEGPVILDGGGR